MLDMSDVFDDELCQVIQKVIRTETINEFGEPVLGHQIQDIYAVVTSANSGNINRYEDSTTYTKSIKVTTNNKLNADSKTGQSDLILFEGNYYEIMGVDNYNKNGYMRAICNLSEFQVNKQYEH